MTNENRDMPTLSDVIDTVWDLVRDIALALAQAFIDATGLFEGEPEYVIGLAIIFVAVYWRLA